MYWVTKIIYITKKKVHVYANLSPRNDRDETTTGNCQQENPAYQFKPEIMINAIIPMLINLIRITMTMPTIITQMIIY